MAHNPTRLPVFWDSTLTSSVKPVSSSFFKSLLGGDKNNPGSQAAEPIALLQSFLPRDRTTLEPLPLVHPSVPYTLSFYHINAVMTAVANGRDPSSLLAQLACRGMSGSRPEITWSITPKVVNGSFLLEHAYDFPINLQHGPGEGGNSYYTKNWFVSSGFRTFAPCSHCTRVFRSICESTNHGIRQLCVGYSLKNVLGQDFRDEWRSEIGRQPLNMCCGLCYADFNMSFEPMSFAVRVRFWSHRDLGAGLDPQDPKWLAAMGIQGLQRDKSDFGRIRSAFLTPTSSSPQIVQQTVSAVAEKGHVKSPEDASGGHEPPPPYTEASSLTNTDPPKEEH
jgi:hypothetical protein